MNYYGGLTPFALHDHRMPVYESSLLSSSHRLTPFSANHLCIYELVSSFKQKSPERSVHGSISDVKQGTRSQTWAASRQPILQVKQSKWLLDYEQTQKKALGLVGRFRILHA